MEHYTLLDLGKYFKKDKEVIRRSINKLNIEAINEHTREHNNIAKLYDTSTLEHLKAEYNVHSKEAQEQGAPKGATSTSESKAQAELVNVLKQQLDKAQEQNDKLLILLQQEQQQRRLLNDNLEIARLELKEVLEPKQHQADSNSLNKEVSDTKDKRSLLDRIFKR